MPNTLSKPQWRERKEAYIAHLEQAGPGVLLVSCADKVHTARAICTDVRTHGLKVFDRFTGARDGTLWYYKTLAATFDRLLPGPLSSELAEVVERLEELSRAFVEA